MTADKLTGQELLAKTKSLSHASKSEVVKACGYVSTKKDGSERLNFTAFYEALLEAKDITIGKSSDRRQGRALAYTTKVHFNGNLMVGAAYINQIGWQPGDQVEIRVGRGKIQLVPIHSSHEEHDSE